MARIESGKASLKIELGSYSELINSLNAVFEPSLKSKNLSYLCYNTVEHDAILCDRTKIREILLNIISNSIKYTPEGGKISVKIEETPEPRKGFASYRITVKDNGIGMSKEYLPHIFEEFTREHSSTESHITGTGLGLPIVKSLVNLMGGTIDVESELGAGTITTVYLTFGLPTEEQFAAHQHKDEILGQSLQTLSEKRVLLAEDNDLNAEIVLTVLEENGIHAEHVKDGALCLKAVQNAPEDYYDVILMDIQMRFMDGMTAAEKIRQMDQKVIIMFITNMIQYAVRGYEVDAMDYVVKPVEYFSFSQKLDKAVGRMRSEVKEFLTIPIGEGVVKIDIADIYFIEGQRHNVIYHTSRGDYCSRITMKELEEKLAVHNFFRCAKGYLVNMNHVEGFVGSDCVIHNVHIPVSRTRKKEFMNLLLQNLNME